MTSLFARLKRSPVRDLTVEVLYGAGLTRPDCVHRGRMCSVSLHRVLPEERLAHYPIPAIAVTPQELRWLLGFFKQHFDCVTLQHGHEILSSGTRRRRPLLAITFDDGQLDNFTHARAVLEEYGLKATFFVPTDGVFHGATLWHDRLGYAAAHLISTSPARVGGWAARLGVETRQAHLASAWVQAAKRFSPAERDTLVHDVETEAGGSRVPSWDGFMTVEQLRTLQQEGHEVGSHSVSHELLPACHDDRLEREVRASKAVLESALDHEVSSFCYPNGSVDARVAGAVRDAGYARAATTAWGNFRGSHDPFLLPRIDMEPAHSRDRRGALSAAQVAYRMSPFHPRFEVGP